MNVTVSRFFQRTPPLEKKESRDDDGNDERFITTTKTQFCDEFSSAHARRVSEMMRVGVFFSPEKRLMMMRETKERERERKREKVAQQKRKSHPPKMAKSKNQKTKKFLLLPLFLLLHFLVFLHSCFAQQQDKRENGEKRDRIKEEAVTGSCCC
jgi:hypothetical protein